MKVHKLIKALLNRAILFMKTLRGNFAVIFFAVAALVTVLTLVPQQDLQAADKDIPEYTHDGLQRVVSSKAALAYVKPGADFSAYGRFMIMDCFVAFKKDWQKEYNRDNRSTSRRISDKDMQRIRDEMAEMFRKVFEEELSENDGYALADAPASDVILIRPAIIDLEATAPDTMSSGRSRTFVDSSGAATLFIELYDSVSGEVLARAVDRKADRSHGRMEWSSRASGRADAKRILRSWAGWLRERMDEVSVKGS